VTNRQTNPHFADANGQAILSAPQKLVAQEIAEATACP